MKVIHITPSTHKETGNGYEIVTLIANRYSRKNHLSYIEKDGKEYMTGGFLLENNEKMRTILDGLPKEDVYDYVKNIRTTPYTKLYYDDTRE